MTPAGVVAMKKNGHDVLVETAAGAGAGFSDAEYIAAGATIADTPAQFLKNLIWSCM